MLEGLCSSNPCRFEFSVLLGCCRNRTDDLRINSPALRPTELVLLRLRLLNKYFNTHYPEAVEYKTHVKIPHASKIKKSDQWRAIKRRVKSCSFVCLFARQSEAHGIFPLLEFFLGKCHCKSHCCTKFTGPKIICIYRGCLVDSDQSTVKDFLRFRLVV